MNYKFFFLIFCGIFLFSVPAEAQCAMCRAVLENEDGGHAAKGINNGIMYLMIFPYLLIGAVGYAIYRNRKKARTEKAS
ncbi:hypothetical protein [Aequorivita echinoideorum]|uniref:Uncharacterized protein n=1 Tax=Aequorivita echinoideorum TaxID=1549647 RepID=A0ABS5S3B2_9FLAO|nr:hypothetical protein [Aequorivita echinoideorum]MBT0607702.1 hypothetical protein [Aequorivita echinoideorum]